MDAVLLKMLLLAFFFCLAASNSAKVTPSSGSSVKSRTLRQSKKCDTPLNVCFVLDGSGSISADIFRSQYQFAGDIITLLRDVNSPRWAATQYGSNNYPITGFTTDNDKIINRIIATQQAGGVSAVSDGIGYCEQLLRKYKADINVIFLFTDGRYNLGVDPWKYIDLVKNEYMHLKVFPVKVGFVSDSLFSVFPSTDVFEADDFLSAVDAELKIKSYRRDACKS